MRSDIVIVLKHSSDTFDVVDQICGHNGTVREIFPDLGVIEATLPAEHVHPLHKLSGVSYVRNVLTYCETNN